MQVAVPFAVLGIGKVRERVVVYLLVPRGQIIAQASETEDEMVIADLDFDLIREVRNTWQFYRDRRPETYGVLTEL